MGQDFPQGVLALAAILAAAPFALPPSASGEAPPAANPAPLTQNLPSFHPLVERVKPAVVSIRVKEVKTEPWMGSPFEGTPFERFFNDRGGPSSPFFHGRPGEDGWKRIIQGQGSGFFISADGYAVTNNHVVAGATSVQVATEDGKTYSAKVKGVDPRTDLALLKVDADRQFAHVTLSGTEAKVGDWVLTMGNPFGLGGTVTAGIVSARGRDIGSGPYDDFLQIDAPVNKGSSGGPTFNQQGEVVGVNTAIYSPSGGNIGIAFSIPATIVERVATQLREKGQVTRGWLGVQIQPVTPEIASSLGIKEGGGALVSGVQSGGPAANAGVQAGDVIVEVNGERVKDARDLSRKVADIAPETEVNLSINRNGNPVTLQVKLGKLHEKQSARGTENGQRDSGANTGSLGLRVAPASEVLGSSKGVAVVGVVPGSRAEEAGVEPGDVILRAGGREVDSPADLHSALTDAKSQGRDHVLALVERDGAQMFVALPAIG